MQRTILSVIVGIVVWVVVALIGLLVGKYVEADIGSFITNVAVLFGVIAAVWYYFKGALPVA